MSLDQHWARKENLLRRMLLSDDDNDLRAILREILVHHRAISQNIKFQKQLFSLYNDQNIIIKNMFLIYSPCAAAISQPAQHHTKESCL